MTVGVRVRAISTRRGSIDSMCRIRVVGREKGKKVVATVTKVGDREVVPWLNESCAAAKEKLTAERESSQWAEWLVKGGHSLLDRNAAM